MGCVGCRGVFNLVDEGIAAVLDGVRFGGFV